MRIVYYVAMSLDGFIARRDGRVDWLDAFENPAEDYGYQEFYSAIDGLLMGRKTYQQVLQFGDWPYPDKPCWVVSRSTLEARPLPEVKPTSASAAELVSELKDHGLQRIWIVGGSELATSFYSQQLIDELILTVIPVTLGAGIPLFGSHQVETPLSLITQKVFSQGVVSLHYQINRS